MKLGAYTACLHDTPLVQALAVLRELGLDSAEVNSRRLPARAPPAGRAAAHERQERVTTTWASTPTPASP